MEVAVVEGDGQGTHPAKDTFCQYLNYNLVRASPYVVPVFGLVYEEGPNRINGSHPSMYLKMPIRFKKDELVPLTLDV